MVKKTLTATLVVSLLFSTSNCSTFNYHLIKDYLQWSNSKAALFVTCESRDAIELNNIKTNDIWLNHKDISNKEDLSDFNYKNFFVRTSYPFCVIVNWECNQTQSILNEISKRKMFHSERNWLIFGKNATEMLIILSEENINVDAEVAIAVRVGEDEYEINDAYNPSHKNHGKFRMGTIGNWNQKTGLKMNETESKFQRRQNLDGVKFVGAIAVPKLPKNKTLIEHLNSDEFPYLDSLSRSSYRDFQNLMDMFNFKLTIRRVKNWGGLKPDGTWIGLVGLLNRSEIDMTITGVRWDVDRYGVFDHTTDSFYVQILFIFRHPKTVDAMNVFLSPFVVVVWLLIFAIGIFTSVFLTNFFLVECRLNMIQPMDDETSYSNCILMVFGILFQQGYTSNPTFISSRVLTLTILLFSLFIYQYYGSFIVGSLLMEAPKTIKTMKQLLNSKLDFAMDDIPYVKDFFQHIREESSVEMYKKIMSLPNPLIPLYKGLDLVKQGSLAYNTDGTYAFEILKSLLTDDELCDLQEVKYAPRIPTGPGLPTKSPLREMIKIGIRKLYETGILAHNWKIWMAHLPKCARSDVDVAAVDIDHFSSALYALAFGIQISICILIGEHIVVKLRVIKAQYISRS